MGAATSDYLPVGPPFQRETDSIEQNYIQGNKLGKYERLAWLIRCRPLVGPRYLMTECSSTSNIPESWGGGSRETMGLVFSCRGWLWEAESLARRLATGELLLHASTSISETLKGEPVEMDWRASSNSLAILGDADETWHIINS
jgi:hypothetical protein